MYLDHPCLADLLFEEGLVRVYAFVFMFNLIYFTFLMGYKLSFEKEDFLIFKFSLLCLVGLNDFLLLPYHRLPLCPAEIQCKATVVWITCVSSILLTALVSNGIHL